jgi:hypothetical protein
MFGIIPTFALILGLPTWKTDYVWNSYSSQGDTLYAVKITSLMGSHGLPTPEWSTPKVLRQGFDVVAVDLRGIDKIRPAKNYSMVPAGPADPSGYEYVETDAAGAVRLWGRETLWKRLVEAGKISCEHGHFTDVEYDSQDSRILYVYCFKQEVAYRFEPPYDHACAIRIGPSVGMSGDSTRATFYSILGQSKAFMRVGSGLYEFDACSNKVAAKIEAPGILAPDATVRAKRAALLNLIGIAADLRIYQAVRPDGGMDAVVEKTGQPIRRFALPAEIPQEQRVVGIYLARSNFVVWIALHPRVMQQNIFSLDLTTGKFRKTSVPI